MADVRSERLEEMKRLYGVVVTSDNVTLVRGADVVILAVKPQILGAVLDEIAPATPGKLLISVAAGVSTSEIRRHLPPGTRLIRVMPNTPALVVEGATAIARADGLADGDLDTARQIFEAVGRAVILDEEMMDAVTGLSGSGPAYIALSSRPSPTAASGSGWTASGPARPCRRCSARPSSSSTPASTPVGSRTWSPPPAAPRSPASTRWRAGAFAAR